MNGIEAFLEILARANVDHLFGNPGTTELPLNDALTRDGRFRYHFALHEIPVMAMADGYAMASGKLAVANVHITCGLGNAMGMLYNAHCEGTPLLLTAGQQDRRLNLHEPVLSGDVVRVAQPWTKWAYQIERVEDIPTATRRAIQVALTPPTGPVFLALPLDVQLERANGLDLSPPSLADARTRPSLEALRRAAEMLRAAKNPAILAGSRVVEAKGGPALVSVAERLGAAVFAEGTSSHGRLPMPSDHPLYRGTLPLWSPEVRQSLMPFDVVLLVGLNVLRLYIHKEPARPLPEHLRLIQLDSSPWEMSKNYGVEVGMLGDIAAGLGELDAVLATAAIPDAGRRRTVFDTLRQNERLALDESLRSQRPTRPMTSATMMAALAKVLPANVAVVEEAITSHQNLLEKLGVFRDPTGHFAHRGWALGWGLGCALGVKLAWPNRPVVGLLGDGAALYGIQGLWSAAHHRIPVTFVIANNSQYQILKVCGDVLDLPSLRKPECPGMNLTPPAVDFVGLARAFGVEAHRVTEPDELSDCVEKSLRGDVPMLIEAMIQ